LKGVEGQPVEIREMEGVNKRLRGGRVGRTRKWKVETQVQ
jgi:hypothetical protein